MQDNRTFVDDQDFSSLPSCSRLLVLPHFACKFGGFLDGNPDSSEGMDRDASNVTGGDAWGEH